MFSTKAVITTAGQALISAADPSNKITITRIDIGSAVATPVAGQEYVASASATSIANVKYSVQTQGIFVGTGLNKALVGVRAKVSKGTTSFWAAQIGVYSNTTLIAVLTVPAVQVNAATADLYLRGTFKADHNKFNLTVGAYSKVISKTRKTALFNNLNTLIAQRLPMATEGSTYFGTSSSTNNSPNKLVAIAPIAATTAEADVEKTRGSSSDIFNNWYRFSHANTWTQPANATEINAWEYVAASDSIRCTVNSATHIGFVSQKKYDKYELDVNLSSTASDDDDIGIVLAFYVDPLDGKEHTLTAIRSPGGFGHSFSIIKDYQLPSQKVLHQSTVIAYGNGGYGKTSGEAGYASNSGIYWSNKGSVRVKATRNGTVFSILTSEFGSTWETLKQSSLFTIDVATTPGLEMFAGKCSYGFSALSQPNASYYTRSFTDEGSTVIDVSTKKTWTKLNGVWTATTYPSASAFSQALGIGRMYHNPVLGKTYFVFPDEVRRIF